MELAYKRYGNSGDQPLIILHGLFGISDNWVTFGKRIASEGFDVIIPDQRNHGKSPHSDVFNYPALTDDLVELVDLLEIKKPILLGHSMGGKVAMRFAIEYPELVKKLEVVDISLKAYDDRPYHRAIVQAMQSIDLSVISGRTEAEERLAEKVPQERIRQFLLKNLHWKDRKTLEWRINLSGIAANLGQMFDAIQTAEVFTKPTLFVRGGASDYILPEDYPHIRHNFPRAEILTIEGASHWVHAEAAEQFYQISSGFLMGNPDWNINL
ncbi:MAG: alpha/beta fold hydrolase [Bacteroidales bacterium]|jgi:pimeloyl-ACP methyl ester carboxylesterase|nr:alpha/beta fold hydrolase [Bacteroidales bacterium]HOI31980.1 alpha/beta fold hydrolase [Bacteroidales bacterium]